MRMPPLAAFLATGAAIVAIIIGLGMLGKPRHARAERLDEMRIDDLSLLASSAEHYRWNHGALPINEDSLVASSQMMRIPADPVSNIRYEYAVIDDHHYRLCATFDLNSDTTLATAEVRYAYPGSRDASWRHKAGQSCFSRTVRDSSMSGAKAK